MSAPPKNRGYYNEKEVAISRNLLIFGAPAGDELLNLWNDFRKVVKFIDENPWVKPMLERIVENKKTEGWHTVTHRGLSQRPLSNSSLRCKTINHD